MLRSTSLLGLVLVALSALFTTGCMAEPTEPADLIWYDDEFNACFTTGKDGKSVEVPCDDAMNAPFETQAIPPDLGCTTPDDCDRSGASDD
ncbi:hypothetical protein [Polyangium jinanense]|uniref:Lipoprotein n=1 Tax=Polyangium jinanense TaxID=2829994 RepID=A0A9X3X9J0_9BACT|nr:hypothetical protein [Polyangium jinanense]MDC3960001.1 hypothetical protein [Polyangium jinanense]MDC3986219.1 hypothetical protein [Polyangium jinanense]